MMVRILIASLACVALVSCGGGARRGGGSYSASATGDISRACMAANRTAATPALCGCVQAAANQTLNGSDQSRAAQFFGDPQLAQDTRQSNRWSDEAFWTRYKTFTETAESLCRA